MLVFEILCVVRIKVFLFLGLLLLGQFFDLPLLIVGSFECPHNSLSSSFYFLDDSDSSFHVGVQGRPFFDDLLFGKVGLFEVNQELLDNLVAFGFVVIAVVNEVARNVHLYF